MDITDELKAHMRDSYRGPSEALLMDMFLLVQIKQNWKIKYGN